MMKVVQAMNHTSLTILYDTAGIALPVWHDRVMNVKMELMPGKEVLRYIDCIKEVLRCIDCIKCYGNGK
jgi:putative lipase involved disintegration of autophagic bodies